MSVIPGVFMSEHSFRSEKATMSIQTARKRLAEQIRAAIQNDHSRSPTKLRRTWSCDRTMARNARGPYWRVKQPNVPCFRVPEGEFLMADQVKSLKQQLTLLASDAHVQLNYLNQGEVAGCVDELALDYDAIVRNAEFMLERGELSQSQCDCVTALDDYLSEISGQANAHVWTPEALHSTEAWREVRQMAKECLRLFE
jgi:hypothetical protein